MWACCGILLHCNDMIHLTNSALCYLLIVWLGTSRINTDAATTFDGTPFITTGGTTEKSQTEKETGTRPHEDGTAERATDLTYDNTRPHTTPQYDISRSTSNAGHISSQNASPSWLMHRSGGLTGPGQKDDHTHEKSTGSSKTDVTTPHKATELDSTNPNTMSGVHSVSLKQSSKDMTATTGKMEPPTEPYTTNPATVSHTPVGSIDNRHTTSSADTKVHSVTTELHSANSSSTSRDIYTEETNKTRVSGSVKENSTPVKHQATLTTEPNIKPQTVTSASHLTVTEVTSDAVTGGGYPAESNTVTTTYEGPTVRATSEEVSMEWTTGSQGEASVIKVTETSGKVTGTTNIHSFVSTDIKSNTLKPAQPTSVSTSDPQQRQTTDLSIINTNKTTDAVTAANSSDYMSGITPLEHTTGRGVTSPTITCPQLPHFQNGAVQRSGSVVEYSCYHGYNLVGDKKRFCLSNGTWSGQAPVCLYGTSPVMTTSPSTIDTSDWIKVFSANSVWHGKYKHGGDLYMFTFMILNVQQAKRTVTAHFTDGSATVSMQGSRIINGSIIFVTKRVIQPNDRIKDNKFAIVGDLQLNNSTWLFRGIINLYTSKYDLLYMQPIPADPAHLSQTAESKIVIIAVAIILTCTVLAGVGVLGYHLLRKRGIIQARQAQNDTLTSFENPVYEFENNYNSSLMNGDA